MITLLYFNQNIKKKANNVYGSQLNMHNASGVQKELWKKSIDQRKVI